MAITLVISELGAEPLDANCGGRAGQDTNTVRLVLLFFQLIARAPNFDAYVHMYIVPYR